MRSMLRENCVAVSQCSRRRDGVVTARRGWTVHSRKLNVRLIRAISGTIGFAAVLKLVTTIVMSYEMSQWRDGTGGEEVLVVLKGCGMGCSWCHFVGLFCVCEGAEVGVLEGVRRPACPLVSFVSQRILKGDNYGHVLHSEPTRSQAEGSTHYI